MKKTFLLAGVLAAALALASFWLPLPCPWLEPVLQKELQKIGFAAEVKSIRCIQWRHLNIRLEKFRANAEFFKKIKIAPDFIIQWLEKNKPVVDKLGVYRTRSQKGSVFHIYDWHHEALDLRGGVLFQNGRPQKIHLRLHFLKSEFKKWPRTLRLVFSGQRIRIYGPRGPLYEMLWR